MTVFVAHAQTYTSSVRMKNIISKLQRDNPDDCFIPACIAFEHLYNGDFSQKEIFDIECDLLSNCDKLLIASNVSLIMKWEIDFAKKVGMEVEYLAKA